jgi:hypothetical protein
MGSNRLMKSTRMIAGLLAGLMFAILAVPLGAETAPPSRVGHGFGPAYDAAHEITVAGTIQKVVTKNVKFSPAGMHLLVAGPQGLVDSHVGAFLSKETKETLHTGTPVELVGAMTLIHGKSYLLVRRLTVGDNSVNVRSKHGALLMGHPNHPMPASRERWAAAVIGGGL